MSVAMTVVIAADPVPLGATRRGKLVPALDKLGLTVRLARVCPCGVPGDLILPVGRQPVWRH